MHKVFSIKKGSKKRPYVIAEVGVNHEASFTKAKRLIDLAVKAGADAVKFQTYKAESLASKHSPAYWDTNLEKSKSQFKLFKKYDKFNISHYRKLYKYCLKKKIDFASTPFDVNSVKFLKPFLKYYKIASADINNIPLLAEIARTKKPVLLSTGASYLKEIKFAVNFLRKKGCPDVTIMHCILNYPTKDNNANLNMISDLKKKFPKNTIGYSDHTLPNPSMLNLIVAYQKGAQVIEKHFTYNKTKKGNDHYHSMDYKDLKNFFENLKLINIIEGKKKKRPISSEFMSRKNARRSIVVKTKVNKNDFITKSNITTKRPGTGITANNWTKIIGKKFKKNFNEDHILRWKEIK